MRFSSPREANKHIVSGNAVAAKVFRGILLLEPIQPTPRLIRTINHTTTATTTTWICSPLLPLAPVRTLTWCLIHTILTHAILADQPDYAVELNNFLQGHPTGNLTPFFQYVMAREGRDDAPIHLATAMCEDHRHESTCGAAELIRWL